MSQDTEQVKQSLSSLLAPRKPQPIKTVPKVKKELRPLPNPKKFNKRKKRAFIEVLRETANFSEAARSVGISYSTAYLHLQNDLWFRDEVIAAREEAISKLEDEIYRRAHFGTEKPVFHQGQQCGTITEYSNDLAMFLLKAARPDIYSQKTQMEVSGPGGNPIQITETKQKLLNLLDLTAEDVTEPNP